MTTDFERPVGAVIRDIIGNLEHIVKGEVRLVKAEARDRFLIVRQATALLAVGGILATLALALILFAGVAALATVVSVWLAALIVAGITGGIAAVVLTSGAKRMAEVDDVPLHSSLTIKEAFRE